MHRRIAAIVPLAAGVGTALVLGCWEPQGSRPGLHLGGTALRELPADWAFSDALREVALEVRTPYLLPHSVTIWCAAADGRLYVGARAPETKHWPGWADQRPDVRLRVGEQLYEVHLAALSEPEEIARVERAYAAKYQLDPAAPDAAVTRYWRVEPRAS